MEEASARRSGGRGLKGCGLIDRGNVALNLSYIDYAEPDADLPTGTALLGMVAFGSSPPPVSALPAPGQAPTAWVDMPFLDGDGFVEVWTSAQPVQSVNAHGIVASYNDEFLFGCLQVSDESRLENVSRLVYARLFDFLEDTGFPFLTRAWNYLPRINVDTAGLERYRQFNIGRYETFNAKGRTVSTDMPAACALGCLGDRLTVYFLASRNVGRPVENPRQVSAFNYPPQYGRRSPTFSRAMLMQIADRPVLSISGTASVVGHETRHAGDPAAQITETLANIRAVIDAARATQPQPPRSWDFLLKAYLRSPAYRAAMEHALAQAFPEACVAYLQADICRSDLLVEVEGMCFAKAEK